MSDSTLLTGNLPPDPDYDPSLDPSAGTLIPSPFLPYTHAIVPYPFDPSNLFSKPMFFLAEHLVGDRPAIVASQKAVVEELRKLRMEEDEVKRIKAMPEFEVKLESDVDINDRRIWRKKLGWSGTGDLGLRIQRYRFYTFVTLTRLLVGYRDRYEWVHKKGRWEPATWYDVDYARRDYVCEVLEWIDDLRYRIEDEWNATCAITKQSKTNDKRQRKRKRTPDVLIEVMQNAPRIPTESGIEADKQEEAEVGDQPMGDRGDFASIASQTLEDFREKSTGSSHQTTERNTCKNLLSETPTVHRPLRSREEKQGEQNTTTDRNDLESDSPEIADSFESSQSYHLPTRTFGQVNNDSDPNIVEGRGNASDPISISSNDEEVELRATRIEIDLTAIDDTVENEMTMKGEDFFEAHQNNERFSATVLLASKTLVTSPWVSINLYCGENVHFRSMRIKRKARFETLTIVVCEQEQIPCNEARFLWKGKEIDLSTTPDSYGMGKEENVHLHHELVGPFKSYPWYHRLVSSRQSTMERQQDSEDDTDSQGEQRAHTITNNTSADGLEPITPAKRAPITSSAAPQTPLLRGIPRLTPPSHPPSHEPSPRAKKIAIEAGFGNYSFLNSLPEDDRRMWSTLLADRHVADRALKNIANTYRELRSPGFTRRLLGKVAEQYPLFQEAIKKQ